ncbi:MAG: HpaII family restriction endonuclease, partial [Thermoplasmatales archaeon]|nr:HpaII family restriction endonuclease [Thermoplasmatales archaeon]
MRQERSENKFGLTEDRVFSDERIRILTDELHYTKPEISSPDGSVIRIQMHDPHTGTESAFRFNIRSFLDGSPTLVNPCGSTNVIFDLTGNMTPELAEAANISEKEGNGVKKRTLSERYQMLRSNGIGMEYAGTQDPVLENNLRMIDSRLPEILAE